VLPTEAIWRTAAQRFRSGLAITHPTEIATFLGDRGIFTWERKFLRFEFFPERLGVEQKGGVLRIGLGCTTTPQKKFSDSWRHCASSTAR